MVERQQQPAADDNSVENRILKELDQNGVIEDTLKLS